MHPALNSTVDMLWLEPTVLGTAPRTHLDGTRERLSSIGVTPRAILTSSVATPSLLAKFRRLARLLIRARRLSPRGVLLARWHPFLTFVAPFWRKGGGAVVLLVQGNDESLFETYPWFRKVPLSGRLIRTSLKEADEVLVLNQGLKTWVDRVRGPDRRISVSLPTGVSAVFLEATADDPPARPYVLFFGNLAQWQGVQYLLDAKRDESWPDELDLWIVGDGEDSPLVEAAAKTDSTIRFFGRMAPAELAPIVAGAYVTACTKRATGSMAETTTPFKMLESAAAGVPVIATDIPAQRRLLEVGGYGVLVDTETPASFSHALKKMHENPIQRAKLAANASEYRSELGWSAAGDVVRATLQRASEEVRAQP